MLGWEGLLKRIPKISFVDVGLVQTALDLIESCGWKMGEDICGWTQAKIKKEDGDVFLETCQKVTKKINNKGLNAISSLQ